MKNIKCFCYRFFNVLFLLLFAVVATQFGVNVYNMFVFVGFELTRILVIGELELDRIGILGFFTFLVTLITLVGFATFLAVILPEMIIRERNSKK